ncbi:MAG: hypothetical protein KTR30_35685 [Saprospiraceae bacterium]|nr:hypothetical protein [Saprospiraceae bacterium]
MLDNRNSGLDPSFIDKAWEDMRGQLDEAMPVESKKRRPVLAWWWWAAALLLPIMIGIGLYPQPQAPELEALPIPGQGKAIAGPNTIQQNQITPVKEMENSDKAVQSSTNSILKNPVISKLNPTPFLPKSPQRTDQQATKSLVEAKLQLPGSTVPAPVANPENTSDTPKTISSSRDVASNRQLLPIMDVLPTGSLLPLPENDLLFEQEATTSSVNSRYAVEMGTSTRSFLTLDGFFVGINKEWQKTGSRWSFGLGVHYRQQLIPFQTTNLLKVNSGRSATDQLDSPVQEETLNGSFEYVDFASGVVGFALGDSAINVPISSLNLIQRLHYIDVPTYANFKMGRKWEAFASVRFSFLAKAHLDHTDRPVSRTTEEFALNNSGGNNGQFGNPPLASYANRLASNTRLGTNTGDFHSFMLSGAMGITYYSSPQVGWRLQYSSTPVSLYNIGSINMRDHWLGTSLIWRFGGK